MARGDKYRKASALSKIFEEMVGRAKGDKQKAVQLMDDELGPEWQIEIVIDDEVGPEFIDPSLLSGPTKTDVKSTDEMLKKARKFSEDFVRPSADLENDRTMDWQEDEEPGCVSDLLRKLADKLDNK